MYIQDHSMAVAEVMK